MMHFATRANDSALDSMRSSRLKRSSYRTPTEEQAARNLVMLEVRMKPSSRGSTRLIVFGKSLLMSWQRT